MSKYYNSYGKNQKVIMFADSDKRHAELLVKLRRDGLSRADFFREIISGYINNNEDLVSFITKVKREKGRVGKKKIDKVYQSIKEGDELMQKLGLTDDDIDFVFDLIERGEDEI